MRADRASVAREAETAAKNVQHLQAVKTVQAAASQEYDAACVAQKTAAARAGSVRAYRKQLLTRVASDAAVKADDGDPVVFFNTDKFHGFGLFKIAAWGQWNARLCPLRP